MKIQVRTPDQLNKMRKAADILHAAQIAMQKRCIPGVSLKELDRIADDIIRSAGAIPNFYGFHGFPTLVLSLITVGKT